MRYSAASLVSVALAIGLISQSLRAQTQEQQDRIDRVSRLVVTAPLCRSMGITVDPDLPAKVAAGLKAETAAWGMPSGRIDQLAAASADRQGKLFAQDLDTEAANAKSAAQLQKLSTILLSYGRTCVEATSDPLFSTVMQKPAGFDVKAAATKFADSMLEDGGLASWQTPAIRARGDMMMSAGICRKRIGKERSDALVAEFGRSEDIRTRDYYLKSFDIGLNDTELNFTSAQCSRLIARNRAEIAKVGTK
ncbi:hypothetical protein C8J42_101913 [Sphingomonas sp. PP-CE-1A-559]|uniref:hypothetical protein n=1 Tax=Sphingomonas sp. PP-CE-1A-559 TaxID=2135657 RepID=UPI0010564CA8|nr:hypothetical protein [Sphingomonas sp. PP-CE-1A-559]TCP94447.1 hypothetical protein C8J42_101913 [Sphingomonas sp. PP-CE-1A-559]